LSVKLIQRSGSHNWLTAKWPSPGDDLISFIQDVLRMKIRGYFITKGEAGNNMEIYSPKHGMIKE
jgi:hypothetical protein